MKLNRTGLAEELPYNDINQKVTGWSLNREGFLNYRNTQVDLKSTLTQAHHTRTATELLLSVGVLILFFYVYVFFAHCLVLCSLFSFVVSLYKTTY